MDSANPPHPAWQAQPADERALSAGERGVCSQPTASCTDLSSPSAGKFEFNPKDGIDNPALSLTEDMDGEGVGEPRFYLLSKSNTETFGFCLHEELGCQGHVIRQVELGGLAQRRGLQDGDRLLQVNGHFVDHMDHRRVSWEVRLATGFCSRRMTAAQGPQVRGLRGAVCTRARRV
uniref:PDZ domain-containing protein n=1 Tax=Athene cunicularia TaxID=194338 RepID=A0A663LYJ5_ATHCN